MELKVILQNGVMHYTFNCPLEYQSTIERYDNDPTAKVIKL